MLRRVEAVARGAAAGERGARSAAAARARVRGAARAARRGSRDGAPLVVVIDDLQWADADCWRCSARSCARPTRRRCCSRHRARADERRRRSRALARELGDDVRRAAARAACRPTRRASWLRAARARRRRSAPMRGGASPTRRRGHPLFIDELVRHALGAAPSAARSCASTTRCGRASSRLDRRRAARRSSSSRVAGAPLCAGDGARAPPTSTTSTRFGRARGAAARGATWCARRARAARHHRALSRSRARGDARARSPPTSGARCTSAWRVGARVRRRRSRSRGAGGALARRGRRRQGGALRRASPRRAAPQALAFDRAARALSPLARAAQPDGADGRSLRVKLGDALANAGRGAEAARAYLVAGRARRRAAEALELRAARAAEQFLRSRPHRRGLDAMRERARRRSGCSCRATPRAR